jgi:hypothetical protein
MAPIRLPTIMEKAVHVARAPNVGDLERHIEFSRRCLALVPPSFLALITMWFRACTVLASLID